MSCITILGIPLVGKLFVPTIAMALAVLVLVLAVSKRRICSTVDHTLYDLGALQTSCEDSSATKESPASSSGEQNKELLTDEALEKPKKKKKKKACCGTKGSCCKTKPKEPGEEKKKCGCGCSENKSKNSSEASSCSSGGSEAEGSDSDGDSPDVLDVEELGRMAEGLRPDLVQQPSPKTARVTRIIKGRVRVRSSEVPKSNTQKDEAEM